jgi:hypothetical protein
MNMPIDQNHKELILSIIKEEVQMIDHKQLGFNTASSSWRIYINERKSKFKKLQDNKIPLTDEERQECLDAKATWNHGLNGKPSPAVWKSINPKTKEVTYITNTHRAFNISPTLKGAIGRYHKFIKGTA